MLLTQCVDISPESNKEFGLFEFLCRLLMLLVTFGRGKYLYYNLEIVLKVRIFANYVRQNKKLTEKASTHPGIEPWPSQLPVGHATTTL